MGPGFLQLFKKNLWNELWVRVVGHELPWSRDARIPNYHEICKFCPNKVNPVNELHILEKTNL